MKRTDILNLLAEKFNLENYLEIGVQNRATNFDKIKCKNKTCVDPDQNAYADFMCTSDLFFKNDTGKFDLIFIDGLHHADQVKKDFENALERLSEKGFIMLHDTVPHAEEFTKVPRETKLWYGDVYKFAMVLWMYNDIEYITLNTDYGCTVIRKKQNANPTSEAKKEAIKSTMDYVTWSEYCVNKDRMNFRRVIADEIISFIAFDPSPQQHIPPR